jgi:hypothetical protein
MLARLRNTRLQDIATVLEADAPHHAREGLYLEHLWQNEDDADEVLFLFRVDDLRHARQFIDKVHAQALRENPAASLPVMTYMSENA